MGRKPFGRVLTEEEKEKVGNNYLKAKKLAWAAVWTSRVNKKFISRHIAEIEEMLDWRVFVLLVNWDESKSTLGNYITFCVRRNIQDFFRRTYTKKQTQSLEYLKDKFDLEPVSKTEVDHSSTSDKLRNAMDQLSRRQKIAVSLLYLSPGLKLSEKVESYGGTKQALYSAASKGLYQLRKTVEVEND